MKLIIAIACGLFLLLTISCNRNVKNDKLNQQNKVIIPPALPIFVKSLQASDTLALNTDTLLYYQRSACFGFCPTYNYTLYQNGMVKYEAIQHVDNVGTHFGLVTDAWWTEVLKEIQKSNFFELLDVYPVEKELYIPDLPNTIITIKDFGKRKSIIDNHHAPKELKDFEFYLESQFQKLEFIKNW
ncbi:MAG: hypothetical protein IPG12_02640 [Saprospiraceae bacterium]|nr:hypothetical protein [Saprospiraceae bacterium]